MLVDSFLKLGGSSIDSSKGIKSTTGNIMDTKYRKLNVIHMCTLLWRLSVIAMCLLVCGIQTVLGAPILPANAFWHVYDVSGSQDLGSLQAPFGYSTANINPPIKTLWDSSGIRPGVGDHECSGLDRS